MQGWNGNLGRVRDAMFRTVRPGTGRVNAECELRVAVLERRQIPGRACRRSKIWKSTCPLLQSVLRELLSLLNHGHKGHRLAQEADRWMKLWIGGVRTANFFPCSVANRRFIRSSLSSSPWRESNWPDPSLRLVTNGFFLHRHQQLPQFCGTIPTPPSSSRSTSERSYYQARLEAIFELLAGWRRDYGSASNSTHPSPNGRGDITALVRTWRRSPTGNRGKAGRIAARNLPSACLTETYNADRWPT